MRCSSIVRGVAILALLVAAVVPAVASTSWEFLFDMARVTDDSQYFLHLAVGNAGLARPAVEPYLPRLRNVETDLPVALFLATHSGRSLEFIVSLRSQGASWSFIFGKCGVPLHTLYEGIDRDPGPPYGKAWGYWKKHGHAARLSDSDVVGLVQVQMGHRIAGVPAWDLAHDRSIGTSVCTIVADTKGRPWKGGKPEKRAASGGGQHGEGHGGDEQGGNDEQGHGKGKGHDK